MEENKNTFVDEPKKNEVEVVNAKKFAKNFTMVLISNILSLLTGILSGFIIPKILGVTDYGYYKTFTLYVSYIGLFHFGFIDGIYLYYAGRKYDSFNKESFRTFTRFLILMQLLVTFIVTIIAMFFIGNELCIILLLVGLDIIAVNVTTYYEFISQISMRFKKVSLRGIIRSSIKIISVCILFVLYKFCSISIAYYVYAAIVIIVNYLLCFWYIFTYRDITFGKASKFKDEKSKIIYFFKLGIPLLISNLIGQFIFVVDQQTVNILFDTDTYSNYAFAYSLINLITVATSAVSVVIYPTLKNMDKKKVTENYSFINSILLIFISLAFACYFILVPFVNYYLPEYNLSLTTFRIILPGVLISSSISVIKYNCYKKFNLINNYLFKSLFVLIVAIIADLIVYFIIGTTNSISIVSIFVLFLWYILVELTMIKKYNVKWIKNLIYIIVSIAVFYSITFIPNIWIGLIIYLFAFICETVIIYNRDLLNIFNYIIKRK